MKKLRKNSNFHPPQAVDLFVFENYSIGNRSWSRGQVRHYVIDDLQVEHNNSRN